MKRIGWGLLIVIGIAMGGFIALLSWGGVSFVNGTSPAPTASVAVAVVSPDPSGAPALGVPVAGYLREAIQQSWGDSRENGQRAHHGTDIPAPPNTPVIAAAEGVVEKLHQSAAGGTTVYVRSPDRRWIYYYAHLSGYASGMREGALVKTGDALGYVGDTGNAGAGNYHLHFGLARAQPADKWYQGTDVDPYPMLAAGPPRS
jgi:murein DD-endopeptidase MepM/ murein hydrolase activator NlpD